MAVGGSYIAIDTLVLGVAAVALAAGGLGMWPARRLGWLGLVGAVAWLIVHFMVWGAPDSPQRAACRFLRAAQRADCAAVFAAFSTEARDLTRVQAERWRSPAENRYCRPGNVFVTYAPNSVQLMALGGDTAMVRVKERKVASYLLPGAWPTKWTFVEHEIKLVRENGEWRVTPNPGGPLDDTRMPGAER
jgi:hypothetical protein